MSSDYIGPGFLKFIGSAGKILSSARAGSANEDIANVAAKQRLISGKVEVSQIRRQGAQVTGKQRAITAASGLASSGTPMEIMLDSANQAELEVELAKRSAKIEANAIRSRGALAAQKARRGIAKGIEELGTLALRHFASPEARAHEAQQTTLQDLWEKANGYSNWD